MGMDLLAANLLSLAKLHLLAPGGQIVAEHSRLEDLADVYHHLRRNDQRRYGDTMISF